MDIILTFFKRPLFIAVPAFVIIILSLILFFLKPLSTKQCLYVFPDNRFTFVNLEQRNIPQNGDKAQNITNYVKELPAGSRNIEMERFINKNTVVNQVILENGILVIDFSKEMNDLENDIPLPMSDVSALMEKNILLNYNGIDKIVITIEGQIPGAPFYSLE